jgi:hypothetical protein
MTTDGRPPRPHWLLPSLRSRLVIESLRSIGTQNGDENLLPVNLSP